MASDPERRNRGLQTLRTISRTVARSLDIDPILNDALDLLLPLLDLDAASVYVLDEHTSEVLSVPSRGVRRPDLRGDELAERDHREMCNRAARSGRVVVVRRSGRVEGRRRHRAGEREQRPSYRTYASVPLCARERVLGVLFLTSRIDHRFTAEDLDVLESIGTQIGLALENARLYQESNQRNRVLAAVNAIAQVLSQSSKLEETLGLTLARILEVMRREGGSIYLRDEETGELVLAVHRIHPGHFVREASRLATGEGDVGRVAATGEVLVVPPTVGSHSDGGVLDCFPLSSLGQADENLSAAAVLPAQGVPSVSHLTSASALDSVLPGYTSYACVPLMAKRQILGVLKVGSFARTGFVRDEIDMLEALGAQLGVALENALQFRTISDQTVRLARRASQLSVLVETSHLMASSVELEDGLALCLRRLGDLLAVPRVLVTLDRGDGNAEVLASYDVTTRSGPTAGVRVRWSDFPHGERALRTGQVVTLETTASSVTAVERSWLGAHDVKSTVVMPLVADGESLGVLSMSSTRGPRSFLPSELDFARTVANQIAIALERARLFQEVRDAASQLEQRVQDRTRALHETNLRLQEISRQRADFLSMISHELRTPLNAILGFSEVMSDPETENSLEEMREYASHVYDSGRHLLRLINDILDLANQRARPDTLQLERLHVEPTLRGMLDVVRAQAVARSVTLRVDVPPDHPPVMVDRVRFKQILYNLLSNAVKFSPPRGEVVVGVRAEGGRARVWVYDEGPGIPSEFHERIFESFFQVDQTISRSFEGAGLGLTLARRYVRLHGGELTVDSGPGRGSRFEFTVALCTVEG